MNPDPTPQTVARLSDIPKAPAAGISVEELAQRLKAIDIADPIELDNAFYLRMARAALAALSQPQEKKLDNLIAQITPENLHEEQK